MVNRQGDEIHFEPSEQAEFDLPAMVSLESACQTADAFSDVARQLIARVEAERDDRNRGTRESGNALQARAARLDRMSKEIFGLLGPEIAESAAVMLYTDDSK